MRGDTLRQLKGLGVVIASLAGIIALILIASRLMWLVAPFAVALALSLIVRPLMRLLTRRPFPAMPQGIAALIATLLIVGVAAAVVILAGGALISETMDFIRRLPEIFPAVQREASLLLDSLLGGVAALPDGALSAINTAAAELVSSATGMLGGLAGALISWAMSIPDVVMFLFVTLTATFFFSKDNSKIREWFSPPEFMLGRLRPVKKDIWAGLAGMLRATLILMGITFALLLIGFAALGVRYRLLLALIIALLDALPMIGVALFLLPWAGAAFLTGDYATAVGLCVILAVVMTVRQLVEPKIMGKNIGIHPLASMISMYVCYKLMGFWGIILGPVILIILRGAVRLITNGKGVRKFIAEYGLPHVRKAA